MNPKFGEPVLTWTMKLNAQGFTSHTLSDQQGVRWGWVVNGGSRSWTAHVGDFGQARVLDLPAPPLEAAVMPFPTLHEAKSWVSDEIAAQWERLKRPDREAVWTPAHRQEDEEDSSVVPEKRRRTLTLQMPLGEDPDSQWSYRTRLIQWLRDEGYEVDDAHETVPEYDMFTIRYYSEEYA